MAGEFKGIGGDLWVEVDIGLEGLEEAEEILLITAQAVADIHKPLFASAAVARNDMKIRFETETDPDGKKWVALADYYLHSKLSKGYPPDILRRTGDLEDSATGGQSYVDPEGEESNIGAFKIVGDSVFFDMSEVPEYGMAHQTGSGNVELVNDPREGHEGETLRFTQGAGRGQALPRRAWLGMSVDAEAEVWSVFDHWFEDATNPGRGYKVSSSGILQHAPSGRFGKKVRL
jgi:Phage virion morphogenesis family